MSVIELALLASLIAGEHLIIRAPAKSLDDVATQLTSIAADKFSFTHAVVACGSRTTLEEFPATVLEGDVEDNLDSRTVVNFVVAKNLDKSERNVQVQALEVLLPEVLVSMQQTADSDREAHALETYRISYCRACGPKTLPVRGTYRE